jgi:hypothetical protein
MQLSIWHDFLYKLNVQMRNQNRHILLLIDNASTHNITNIDQLSNVTIHHLPPNTTSHLQPLDAGIINSFKAQYRKILVKNHVDAYDDTINNNKNSIDPINILDAINFCNEAWNTVTQLTIVNCWRKTKILPDYDLNTSDKIVEEIHEEEIRELQGEINKLDFNESISAMEFINIDSEIPIEDFSDAEIIETVRPSQNNVIFEEVVEHIPSISVKNALECSEKVLEFLKNPPSNFSYNLNTLGIFTCANFRIGLTFQIGFG